MTQVADRKDLKQPTTQDEQPHYKGLPSLLHGVRWTQHFFAILAEALILLSFAASGMDVSIGGAMARIDGLAWIWAAIFAIGVDTSFVVSWVRVRQCVDRHRWGVFIFNLILAIGMSIIVFQPVAIQLLQQSMSLSFGQALQMLGMNIVQLVYARAIVAVLLGAILATTNVERGHVDSGQSSTRRLAIFDKWLDKVAPKVDQQAEVTASQKAMPSVGSTPVTSEVTPVTSPKSDHLEEVTTSEESLTMGASAPGTKEVPPGTVHQNGHLHLVTNKSEKIRMAILANPELTNRQIAGQLNVSHTTVAKYRDQLASGQ